MTLSIDRAIERSVDSLEKTYAVIVALAISEAIQSLLKAPAGNSIVSVDQIAPALPAFTAFLFTLVPFFHGMNRHFDRAYLEKSAHIIQGALILDFSVFLLEATCLFAVAWSLRSGILSFACLGLLLLIDMIWGFVSHQIHYRGQKSGVVRWSAINLIAIGVSVFVVAFPFEMKTVVLMVIAILRTIADYVFCWSFYFPTPPPDGGTTA